jgi:hypothetical protein
VVEDDLLANLLEEQRPRLRAVAYRMLGSLTDARSKQAIARRSISSCLPFPLWSRTTKDSSPKTSEYAVRWYFAKFSPTVAGARTGLAGLWGRASVVELLAWHVARGWRSAR